MASKENPEPKAEDKAEVKIPVPSGKQIEEYRDELGTDPATFAGVKARERWPAQRRVTKRQYETAVEKFLTGKSYGGGS